MISCSSILRCRDLIWRLYLNEISIDIFWRGRLSLDLDGVNFRPLKYNFLNSSRVVRYFFRFFWSPFLVVFNSYLFVHSIFFPVAKNYFPLGNSIWLESSLKSEQIRGASGLAGLRVVDVRRHEYFIFLSRPDRARMFLVTLYLVIFRSSLVNISNKIQLIDAYRVLCFLEFVSRANDWVGELHICNHYDRWAMACFEGFSKGVNVWQHGILDESLDLPVKLKNIRCIHSLSLKEAGLWRNYLADVGVEIVVQKTSFMLSLGVKKVDILIISHPAYTVDEVSLLMFLLSNEAGLSVAYKPHPAYDYSKILAGIHPAGVDVVPASEYPDAALAITKGSTLGHEYEAAGVNVIWWGHESQSELLGLIEMKLSVRV